MRANEGALEYTLRVLRRRKFVILAALISVPLFAFLYSSAQTKEYTASATLLFESENETFEASREAATNEALAALPEVAVKATRELGGEETIDEVLGSVEVSSVSEMANVISIAATNESPQRAAEVANAYANAYIDFRRESDRRQFKESIAVLETRLDELPPSEASGAKGELLREQLNELEVEEALQTGRVSSVQEAGPPSDPSRPKTQRNVVLGLVFGLILGLGLAALIERLDKHVRSVEELEELFGLPIIARIPRTKAFKNASAARMLLAPEAEALRTLRTNLRYLNINRDLTSVLIASSEPNDGKSTVARGLAGAMVEMGDDVVLVEADLRKESAFRYTPGYVPDGLSGVLAGAPLENALMQVPVSQGGADGGRAMTVLPSGPMPPNPSELLEGERMNEVMAELSRRYDMVVIDSPAIGFVSDAMSLVPKVSAILAVGGIGKTTRDGATGFVEQLELTGNRPLGLIATMTPSTRRQYSYYSQSRPPLLRR
jgi:polysaccharide biosynthesis transport protein